MAALKNAIKDANRLLNATGYDGNEYTIGDRVELHPSVEYCVQGARYGEVVGMSLTSDDKVHIKFDKLPNRKQHFAGSADTFRKI